VDSFNVAAFFVLKATEITHDDNAE